MHQVFVSKGLFQDGHWNWWKLYLLVGFGLEAYSYQNKTSEFSLSSSNVFMLVDYWTSWIAHRVYPLSQDHFFLIVISLSAGFLWDVDWSIAALLKGPFPPLYDLAVIFFLLSNLTVFLPSNIAEVRSVRWLLTFLTYLEQSDQQVTWYGASLFTVLHLRCIVAYIGCI